MIVRGMGRVVCAVAAAGSVAVLAGCSKPADPALPVRLATASPAPAAAAVPAVSQLDQEVRTVLDPAVPNESKLQFIQGDSADPELPNKLAQAYRQGNATIAIKGVQSTGPDSASATAQFTFGGQPPSQAVVPMIYENEVWKIEHSWACNALVNLNVQSPACP